MNEKKTIDYHQQAFNCVFSFITNLHKEIFSRCDLDIDKYFETISDGKMYFSKRIKKNHHYYLGYYHCTCSFVTDGTIKEGEHCECSKESISIILQTLLPNKNVYVTILQSILRGQENCVFDIKID